MNGSLSFSLQNAMSSTRASVAMIYEIPFHIVSKCTRTHSSSIFSSSFIIDQNVSKCDTQKIRINNDTFCSISMCVHIYFKILPSLSVPHILYWLGLFGYIAWNEMKKSKEIEKTRLIVRKMNEKLI